jgi:hypothetical protein
VYFVTHGLANSGTSFNPAPGIPLDFHASVKTQLFDTAMAVRQSILESEMMIAQGIKIEE